MKNPWGEKQHEIVREIIDELKKRNKMKVLPGTKPNRKVTRKELSKIRKLADFDLIMLISEIHDHGWETARRTLEMMP